LTKQKRESDIYLGCSIWEAAYKVLEYMIFVSIVRPQTTIWKENPKRLPWFFLLVS